MYEPQKILVTGGCGFIGSHLIEYLIKKYPNYKIINIDKLDYCSSLQNIKLSNNENYQFIQLDLQNQEALEKIFASHKFDTVLHLAAFSHVEESFGENVLAFTKNNVMGTHCLLEAVRKYKVKRFIHCSTDEVYGDDPQHQPCFEEGILAPSNPYAATKAAAECLVQSYIKSFDLPIIIIRPNNIFGPRQFPEKVIPNFICRLISGQKVLIHGKGEQRRRFIYIDDCLKAFDLILLKGITGEIYNIGTDFEISIIELAYKLIKIILPTEQPDEWIQFIKDRPYNDFKYHLNASKLQKLGWQDDNDFDIVLKETIDWYQKHLNDCWWQNRKTVDLLPSLTNYNASE